MRHVFVTGGAGFIGSHIVDYELARGNRVTAYDNLVSGRVEFVSHHVDNPRFTLVEADLLDGPKLKAAMSGHDFVWHMGGNTDIRLGSRVPDHDLRNCTIATANVLEAMRSVSAKEMIFSSSSTVYGDRRGDEMAEEKGPLLPICLYGAAKLACEGLLSSYAHLFGIRSWIFRFGNVVGARMGHGSILDFIGKLRADPSHLEVLGDGTQQKPFFTVEDCINGMSAISTRAELDSDVPCDVFNLGPSRTTQVRDVAQVVIEEMGLSNVAMHFTGGRQGWRGDVPDVRLDVSKARSLGWEARNTSDEAVRIAVRRLLHAR